MSFVLCHDCYTWVEPRDDRCPECLLVMDLSAADPPSRLLRELMGDIVDRLGEVRVPRRLLPEWGTLYATTQGLFFLPHEMDFSTAPQGEQFTGTSLMWTLGSLFWSPLVFLLPFVREPSSRETSVRVLRPRHLVDSESGRMPELLMENPGAFFLPKTHIRTIDRKRSRWVIDRSVGGRLLLLPVDSPWLFHERLLKLLSAPAWQGY